MYLPKTQIKIIIKKGETTEWAETILTQKRMPCPSPPLSLITLKCNKCTNYIENHNR